MSFPIQVMYLTGLKNGLEKNKHFYIHSHNSIIHTGQKMEGIQVSMDRQFHKQTCGIHTMKYDSDFKVGNS